MCGKCGGLLLSKFKAHTWDDERGFLYNLKSCHFFAITHVYMAAPSRLLGLELLEMTSRLSNLIYSSLRSCQQSEQEYLPLIFRRALSSHQYVKKSNYRMPYHLQRHGPITGHGPTFFSS